ncbi:MAG: hypothetical protein P8Y66_07130 [Nitrospirota bacterium]|jgi:hypothetical protein
MDTNTKMALVAGVFALSLLLNLPMGYLRKKTRKFSLAWFLCIHAPIPFIYAGRVLSGLDMIFIPLFVVAAVLGQVLGGRLNL